MRLNASTAWSLLASTLLLTSGAWAKKDKPAIKSNEFDFVPIDVSYFEDSDVILFADYLKGDVYRSANAGESWDRVDGPPHGSMVEMLLHPFDHKRAYYISAELSHWFTEDRGETWQEFKTGAPPSVYRSALTFHAEDVERIIFNAGDCTVGLCEDIVSTSC